MDKSIGNKLSAKLLEIAGNEFSGHTSNDLPDDFWNDISIEERKSVYNAYHKWNMDEEEYNEDKLNYLGDGNLMLFFSEVINKDPKEELLNSIELLTNIINRVCEVDNIEICYQGWIKVLNLEENTEQYKIIGELGSVIAQVKTLYEYSEKMYPDLDFVWASGISLLLGDPSLMDDWKEVKRFIAEESGEFILISLNNLKNRIINQE